ncbi:MAG: hypothetical protein P9X22_07170 [Candidatus Zapsychrus exili]|nr:hypothetical protein [Candidatus Zapsychrus exili]
MKKITIEQCEQISISVVVRQQKYHILKIKPNISLEELNSIMIQRLDNLYLRSLMYNGPLRLSLTSSALYFGGIRYWFKCPACENRVGKLYKPVHEEEFKCRQCHNLTYKSTQTHNQKVSTTLKYLDDIEKTKGEQEVGEAISIMKQTRKGRRLFWKLYDKRVNTGFPPPFFARKNKEDSAYDKYVRVLLES